MSILASEMDSRVGSKGRPQGTSDLERPPSHASNWETDFCASIA